MDLLRLNGYKSSSGDYNSVIYVVFILCFALFSKLPHSYIHAGYRPEYNEKKNRHPLENITLRSVNKIMAVITATDKFMYFSSGQRAQ